MTYFITAIEDTRGRCIESETRTTDPVIADMVAANLEARGFIVIRRAEG